MSFLVGEPVRWDWRHGDPTISEDTAKLRYKIRNNCGNSMYVIETTNSIIVRNLGTIRVGSAFLAEEKELSIDKPKPVTIRDML